MSRNFPEIRDLEIEKRMIAILLQYPNSYYEIESFIDEKDFTSKLGRVVFAVIRKMLEQNETVDYVVVAERVKGLGMTFVEDVSVLDILSSLNLMRVKEDAVETVARSLGRITARRLKSIDLHNALNYIHNECNGSEGYTEIMDNVEKLSSKTNLNYEGINESRSIFEEMRKLIENREEEDDSKHWFSPYPKVNDIFGSLFKGSEICVVLAPSGQGKTTIAFDVAIHVAEKYNGKVLHMDMGELNFVKVVDRCAAKLSGVPMYYISSGKYKKNKELVDKVNKIWPTVERIKDCIHYKDIAGMSVEEICLYIKKFYNTRCVKGEKIFLSIDYLKCSNMKFDSNIPEHIMIARFVDNLKKLINSELLVDGEPVANIFTSLQTNAQLGGMTNSNKTSKDINDSEDAISLSKKIMHLVTHMFILRKKMPDEIAEHPNRGTHILKCLKARDLGRDIGGYLNLVKYKDRLVHNYINLEFNNFDITEKGDLRDIVAEMESESELETEQVDKVDNF